MGSAECSVPMFLFFLYNRKSYLMSGVQQVIIEVTLAKTELSMLFDYSPPSLYLFSWFVFLSCSQLVCIFIVQPAGLYFYRTDELMLNVLRCHLTY